MCYSVITLCVVFGVMVLYQRFVFQCCTGVRVFVSIQVVVRSREGVCNYRIRPSAVEIQIIS